DAHVHELSVRGLLVGEEQIAVDRDVVLTVRIVDLRRREERVHAEGAGLVRDDRHDPVTNSFSRMRSLSTRTNPIVVAIDCLPEPRRPASKALSDGILRSTYVVRRSGE